ncbi:MAG TPA: hypothetical protein PK684_04435 [Bacillota bacterium]|jgi:hypothetical protein|nr:hypothetical protein [Bacillota bacterium]
MKYKSLALYILVVMLILTGCGGGDGETSAESGPREGIPQQGAA